MPVRAIVSTISHWPPPPPLNSPAPATLAKSLPLLARRYASTTGNAFVQRNLWHVVRINSRRQPELQRAHALQGRSVCEHGAVYFHRQALDNATTRREFVAPLYRPFVRDDAIVTYALPPSGRPVCPP